MYGLSTSYQSRYRIQSLSPANMFLQDRSLGSIDVHVSDLAKESDDKHYPFDSTGRKAAAEQLRLDKGNVYKGNLHYSAEFIPAIKLKHAKFDSHPNEIQRAAEASDDEDGGYVTDGSQSSSDEEHQAVPVGVTIQIPKKRHSKGAPSTDTTRTNDSVDTLALLKGGESQEQVTLVDTSKEPEGIEMTTEELLTHRESVLIYMEADSDILSRIWNYCFQCNIGTACEEGAPRSSLRRCLLAML